MASPAIAAATEIMPCKRINIDERPIIFETYLP
jgi:hypothetical protein